MKKKLLIITLCLILVISCLLFLCGCDDDKKPSDETGNGDQTGGITKAEWDSAFASSNFDNVEVANTDTFDDNVTIQSIKLADDIAKIEQTFEYPNGTASDFFYEIKEGDKSYLLTQNRGRWFKSEVESNFIKKPFVENKLDFVKNEYENVEYDKNSGTYKYEKESLKIEIKFNNQKIEFIKYESEEYDMKMNFHMRFSNYGEVSLVAPDIEKENQSLYDQEATTYYSDLSQAWSWEQIKVEDYFDENCEPTEDLLAYLKSMHEPTTIAGSIYAYVDCDLGCVAVIFVSKDEKYIGMKGEISDGEITINKDSTYEEKAGILWGASFRIDVDNNGNFTLNTEIEDKLEAREYAYTFYANILQAVVYDEACIQDFFDENLLPKESLITYLESEVDTSKVPAGTIYAFMGEKNGHDSVNALIFESEKGYYGMKGEVTLGEMTFNSESSDAEKAEACCFATFIIEIDSQGNFTIV